jgi:HAD superfamily hydrolase (TIGR01509 family)
VPIQTVFLDAGGVLVNPNWSRVSDALGRHGVDAGAALLAAAEPRAKKRLDTGDTIKATNDQQRGWTYFNLVLTEAGVPLSDATAAALAELHTYHQTHNLWETVPDEVLPALSALRAKGLRLVVLSNANGTLHRAFDRLGLTSSFDVIFDSHREGVEKPDPRFFHIALERAGADAGTTMHVGELYHVDVAGARAAGLTPALLDVDGLYPECDCLRVRSLTELVEVLQSPLQSGGM